MKKLLLLLLITLSFTACKKDKETVIFIGATGDQKQFYIKINYVDGGEIIYESSDASKNFNFGQRFNLKPNSKINMTVATGGRSMSATIQCSGVDLLRYSTENNIPGESRSWQVTVPNKN